jgi:hypothetical protein
MVLIRWQTFQINGKKTLIFEAGVTPSKSFSENAETIAWNAAPSIEPGESGVKADAFKDATSAVADECSGVYMDGDLCTTTHSREIS